MEWSWFDLAWPWIGAAAAAVFIVLLFGTNLFRGDPSASRWRDRIWLSWLPVPIYMILNVEEYGIDLLGRRHEFPDAMCSTLGLGRYPASPLPPPFFLAVNLSLIWVAAPLAGWFSRKHPLVGLIFYGLLVTNGMTHVVPMLFGMGYSPGTASAIALFFPAFLWIVRACFGPGRIGYPGLAVLVGSGVLLHLVLAGSVFAFIYGWIGSTALAAIQILNAALFLFIPWIAEKRLGLAKVPIVFT